MKNFFFIIAILAVIGFLGSSFYQIFYKNRKAFDEKNTVVKIDGPQSLELGDPLDISVSYKNDSRANLKNAVLTLNYPRDGLSGIRDKSGFGKIRDSAIVWEIGEISGGYEGTVKISATVANIYAAKFTAELCYEPENFNSEFSARNEFTFSVKPAKISLNLFAPKEMVIGQEIKYILTYTNATSFNFDAIRIKFNYPLGFTFSESIPPAGQDGAWEITNFARASSGQIEVKGTLGESGEDAKAVNAAVEQRGKDGNFIFNNEISAATSLIGSPFAVTQTVNDKENYSASAGDNLNYKIKLRNLNTSAQNNLIVVAALNGEAADYATLAAENASVDSQAHTITWNSGTKTDLANFESDKEMELVFSIKARDKMAVSDAASKNFLIRNMVLIKNGNIFDAGGGNKVIVSSSFDTKINSSVELYTRGYFNDDGRIKTSGPIPPKVGETTAYNIKWQILNSSNKIKNAKVAGILPANVRWTGEIFPLDAKISYDVNTRVVAWEAGDLEPATGILSPLKEVIFQVSITPVAEDAGNYLVLIDQNSLTATDDFTLSEIAAKSEGITTRLPDDVSIGPDEGKVAM